MGSKSLFISLFFLLTLLSSCAKEDVEPLSVVGKWKGESLYEKTVNGVLEEGFTTSELFELELKSNESGKMILADGTVDVLEWYMFDSGRKIVLYRKIEKNDGRIGYEPIRHFEILINNIEYQEWLYTAIEYTTPMGDEVRFQKRWQLTKK